MSHPATLKELFEHIRHYEPKIYVRYEQWFNDAIARYEQRQPSVPVSELKALGGRYKNRWGDEYRRSAYLPHDYVYWYDIIPLINKAAAPEPKERP